MALLRGLLAGFCAVVGVVILTFITMTVVLAIKSRSMPEGESIGWDPISLSRSIVPWVILVCTFAAGYAWEYRRASRAGR